MGHKNSKLESVAAPSALSTQFTSPEKIPHRKSIRISLKRYLLRRNKIKTSNAGNDETWPYIAPIPPPPCSNSSLSLAIEDGLSEQQQQWEYEPRSSKNGINGLYRTLLSRAPPVASMSYITIVSIHPSSTNHGVVLPGQPESDEDLARILQEDLYRSSIVSDDPPLDTELVHALEQEVVWQEHIVANPQIDEDHALAFQLQIDLESEERAPVTRECAVCSNTTPIPELPALMACVHPPQTCAECFAEWIAAELENKGWKDIKCPEIDCQELVQHIEVQLIAKPEIFQRYDQLSTREVINDDPDWKWCLRSGCPSGQSHPDTEEDPVIVCIECEFRMCAIHNREWHEGETCQEYDYRVSGQKDRDQAAQEEASQNTVNELSKKCPGKKCAYNIEKNEGCDHMTCSKCKHEFCWECSADYNAIRRSGNSAHKKRCKYRM